MFLRIVLMLAMVGALGAVGFVLLNNDPQTSSAEAAPVSTHRKIRSRGRAEPYPWHAAARGGCALGRMGTVRCP